LGWAEIRHPFHPLRGQRFAADSLGVPPPRLDAQSLLELTSLLEVLTHPKQKD
jgi:hypothetical protein